MGTRALLRWQLDNTFVISFLHLRAGDLGFGLFRVEGLLHDLRVVATPAGRFLYLVEAVAAGILGVF